MEYGTNGADQSKEVSRVLSRQKRGKSTGGPEGSEVRHWTRMRSGGGYERVGLLATTTEGQRVRADECLQMTL